MLGRVRANDCLRSRHVSGLKVEVLMIGVHKYCADVFPWDDSCIHSENRTFLTA